MAQQAGVVITLRSSWLTSTAYEVMELSTDVNGSYLTGVLFQRMMRESFVGGETKPLLYLARAWTAYSRRTAWTLRRSSGGPRGVS